MSSQVTLSQQPFSDGDYTDGEVKKLVKDGPLWVALHTELWLNYGDETRRRYLDKLAIPVYFAGTVISVSRGQVELTIISLDPAHGGPGEVTVIAITLDKITRFT